MKIALLAMLLAGQAFATPPTSDWRVAPAPAYLQEATPAYAETFTWANQAAPAPARLQAVRAGSSALKRFLGTESSVSLCDKARSWCDGGSGYWCRFLDQRCNDNL